MLHFFSRTCTSERGLTLYQCLDSWIIGSPDADFKVRAHHASVYSVGVTLTFWLSGPDRISSTGIASQNLDVANHFASVAQSSATRHDQAMVGMTY